MFNAHEQCLIHYRECSQSVINMREQPAIISLFQVKMTDQDAQLDAQLDKINRYIKDTRQFAAIVIDTCNHEGPELLSQLGVRVPGVKSFQKFRLKIIFSCCIEWKT